jgi:hypothetical protein
MFKDTDIQFAGFLLDEKPKTSNQRFSDPVATITFNKGKGENKCATLTFNKVAAKLLDLNLLDSEILENRKIEDEIDEFRPSISEMDQLSKFSKKALKLRIANLRAEKKINTVTFFTGKNAAGEAVISLFNSTQFGNKIPENKKQTVSASANTVKLPAEEVKKLYELNGIVKDDLIKAEDWIFDLIIGSTTIGEITGKSCFLVKRQIVVEVEKKERERSDAQNILSDNIEAWFEAERKAGRTPSPRKYWKAHREEYIAKAS